MAKERERAIVVTSDHEIVDFAVRHGAATIDSREFEAKLTMASYAAVQTEVADEESGWSKTTKKKGPARRLPKQRRKSRQKIRKL